MDNSAAALRIRQLEEDLAFQEALWQSIDLTDDATAPQQLEVITQIEKLKREISDAKFRLGNGNAQRRQFMDYDYNPSSADHQSALEGQSSYSNTNLHSAISNGNHVSNSTSFVQHPKRKRSAGENNFDERGSSRAFDGPMVTRTRQTGPENIPNE